MFDSDRSIESCSRRQFITRTGLAGFAASLKARGVVPEGREADDVEARVGNGWEKLRELPAGVGKSRQKFTDSALIARGTQPI